MTQDWVLTFCVLFSLHHEASTASSCRHLTAISIIFSRKREGVGLVELPAKLFCASTSSSESNQVLRYLMKYCLASWIILKV